MYKLLTILLFAYGLALTTEDIYDNSYALIIGIDKYENVSNLDYAVSDANSIASLLRDNFNFPSKNVKVLLNNEATYLNIRESLDEISSLAKENDRVLIFFAGHGLTNDLPDGGEMGYILPIDGKRDKLFATSIPMEDMKRISSMSQSKHMLFLIDACYGGLAATGARGISSTTPNFIDKITNDKSRQIITAGGRGEQVIEKSEWGHSAFTMNLIRALKDGKADFNDDGFITADELGLFLKDKVSIDSDNQQTPQSRRYTSHEGEFVFVYSENTIINQQADSSTDDEFQALVLDKLDKLEKQADKTQPDLMVNPYMQLSDTPLLYSIIYSDKGIYGRVTKQLDKRAVVGIGLKHKHKPWAGTWEGGGTLDYTSVGIDPFVGYYLTSRRTKIFNPLIILGMHLNLERWKVETQQLNDEETEGNLSLSLFNHIEVDKDFGFSIGLQALLHGLMEFNEYGELYVDRYEFKFQPIFYLDFTKPKNNFGTLSSSDKVKSLNHRKKDDLINLSIGYGIHLFAHYWTADGITIPVLFIPAIGPFLSFSDEYDIKGYENITLFSGVLQTYFLFDYIRTSRKLKGLNNNISYQINPNPIAPSVKFTYNFD